VKVECLTVGAMASNCYLVWCEDTKEAIVIDPGSKSFVPRGALITDTTPLNNFKNAVPYHVTSL
jgi:glyoxylase-like metal-dependent hydrolase (beta-lactamase superfamily II)